VITTPQRQAIGCALRKARVLVGMTQQDLADAMGITQGQVSQWEMGMRDIPASVLLDLSKCGIKAAEVFIQAELELRV
jgi:transcriptional regulator with XRE-family HTH domain